ncbi:MAG TPA: asparaginase [Burkholderiaceae bacterium]|nr:asparaginase [Burkholderiaceae bacterium]
MSHPVLAELRRGEIVESFHRGSYAVVDSSGTIVASAGDTERPVYPRSAIKSLQALPLVASGAADRFDLDDAELALACASHGGEPAHVATASSMLAKAGLDSKLLECGTHWPLNEDASRALAARRDTPRTLHNNCSGKHAGFACLGCLLAGDADAARGFLRGYVEPDHRVMREVGAAIEAATGVRLANAPRAIDGCSIPTYGLPLRALAHAFARLGTGHGLAPEHARAATRLRAAVAAQPFMVAGSGRLDTALMLHFGERLFCKVGAEGVYCAALPERGFGLALKIDDGNNARAAEVVLVALVEALLPLSDLDRAALASRAEVTLRNWNGLVVGRLSATDAARPAGIASRLDALDSGLR